MYYCIIVLLYNKFTLLTLIYQEDEQVVLEDPEEDLDFLSQFLQLERELEEEWLSVLKVQLEELDQSEFEEQELLHPEQELHFFLSNLTQLAPNWEVAAKTSMCNITTIAALLK